MQNTFINYVVTCTADFEGVNWVGKPYISVFYFYEVSSEGVVRRGKGAEIYALVAKRVNIFLGSLFVLFRHIVQKQFHYAIWDYGGLDRVFCVVALLVAF